MLWPFPVRPGFNTKDGYKEDVLEPGPKRHSPGDSAGFDRANVSQCIGPDNLPEETTNNPSSLTFIAAARRLGDQAPRVIHLGGGSTLRRDGQLLLETRDLEERTPQHGLVWGHWLTLQNYRATSDVKWTVISPSGNYIPDGPRTGKYGLGGNEVLVDENGRPGGISHRDLAVALVDEIEQSQSIGRRITVGY